MVLSKKIRFFLFSKYFSHGLRITLGVALPSILLAQMGYLSIGITLSLGAYCVSLCDLPGPLHHKKNGMIFSILFIFLTVILTELVNQNPIFISIEIIGLCFLYSMFSVYGTRASLVGIGAILVMILTIDHELTGLKRIEHAFYILTGGVWYMLLSLFIFQLKPYRLAQQTLGECIQEIAAYLRLRASFYDIESDYNSIYKALVSKQVIIHQLQDAVRELLFRSSILAKEPTSTERLLIMVFIDMVDLFEQTMALPYDYRVIRKKYGKTDVLKNFQVLITKLANELENIASCTIENTQPIPLYKLDSELKQLNDTLAQVEKELKINTSVLKNRLSNMQVMCHYFQKIYLSFNQKTLPSYPVQDHLHKFVSHQYFEIKSLKENLSLSSSSFRYALRMTIACLSGYLISMLFSLGHHSYWILLSIAMILRSDFSQTKQRNYQRILGTIIGGIAGACLLFCVSNQSLLLIILLICMIISFSFQYLNYVISVAFLTPYILIMFNFLGENSLNVAKERIIDTLIGSSIAFIASNFIFPSWQSYQLKGFLKKALIANYNYLLKVVHNINQKPWDIIDYKLLRKEVYVSTANIGDSFQRMLQEPKSKQKNIEALNEFVIYNHMLSSCIATLIHDTQQLSQSFPLQKHTSLLKESLYQLGILIRKLDPSFVISIEQIEYESSKKTNQNAIQKTQESKESKILWDQLELVKKIIDKLYKINKRFFID